jgi:phosphoribosylformylglycinamidine (FGAM) synthase-like enzyme
MKDTAVKFLVDEISCRFKISEELFEAIYKAIAMEKEQIIAAYENGAEGFNFTAEEYYQENCKPEII